MREEILQLLPLIKNGEVPMTEIDALLEKLRTSIKAEPSRGKELGQLVQLINSALKSQTPKAEINWVPVEKGFLAIGHKPGGKLSFEGMKNSGTTVIVTLLQENEGAQQIGSALQKAAIDWIWFPFSASHAHMGQDTVKVFVLFEQLKALLDSGNKIYIHCSAGIHRTGMIAYGLLRYLGKEADEAVRILKNLREVTAAQVGEDRLTWGDQFAQEKERNK